jgi:plasmid stabilization system protein ParE
MRTLVVRAIAEADIDEAYAWYAARSVQAAARFLDTVALTLTAISRHPESFPTAYPGLRRALLPRYPFGIYFHVDERHFRVVAVVHTRRHPRRWIRRREA